MLFIIDILKQIVRKYLLKIEIERMKKKRPQSTELAGN